MTLLNPWALLLGLVIGVLLLLHFRRRTKRVYRVANPEMWRAGGEVKDTRPLLKRIQKSWLLLLQILFLATVVLALARPSLNLWTSPGRTIVLVLDCSASMASRERDGTRFDRARARAISLLDALGRNDRIAIVQARPQPVVHSYRGSEAGSMRSALRAMSPTQAPADLYGAVILGLSALPQGESCEVFVFSDGTRAAQLPGNMPAAHVHYLSFGETGNNVAITRLAVRSQPNSAYDHEAFAEVTNFSGHPQRFALRMTFEDQELLVEQVELAPAQRRPFVCQVPSGKAGALRAAIDVRDDLDADNQAYAVVGSARISVLLVTQGNLFLEKALAVNPQVAYRVLKPEACSAEELAKSYDVRIFDGFVPANLPLGNDWLIRSSASAAAGGATRIRGIHNLVLTRPNHPIASFIELGNVAVDEAWPVTASAGSIALVTGNDLPLLTVTEHGASRTVESGFDLRASNLPLTVQFPVLVSNIVRWLGGAGDDAGNQVVAGSTIELRLMDPRGGTTAEVTDPKGLRTTANLIQGMLSFAGTETTGVYAVRSGGSMRKFAVNLFDASESDIRPVAAGEQTVSPSAGPLTLERSGFELWRILLLVAIAILMLEWLYQKKKRKVSPR